MYVAGKHLGFQKLGQGEFFGMEDDPKKKRAEAREADQNEVLRVFGGGALAPMIPSLVGEIRKGAVGLPECFYLPE